jgi:hypothetical protein
MARFAFNGILAITASLGAGHGFLVAQGGGPALGLRQREEAGGFRRDDGAVDGERPVAKAVRVLKGPVVDGRLDDEVWRQAPAAGPLIQVVPVEGAKPSERTEFRVLYDDQALYIGVWCFDREPGKILAREMARDGKVYEDDYITIALDTFHDQRNCYLPSRQYPVGF